MHIKLLGDLPVGSGTLGEARKAAGYLSKYVDEVLRRRERPPGCIVSTWRRGSSRRGAADPGRSAAAVIADSLGAGRCGAADPAWSSAEVAGLAGRSGDLGAVGLTCPAIGLRAEEVVQRG